jgi:hypothetical protein
MTPRLPLLAGLAFIPMAALSAPASAPAITVVTHGDTAVYLSNGSIRKRIDLAGRALSPAIETAKTLFEREEHGRLYIVLDVGGPTIPDGGKAECGAGEEDSLVWLELSAKLSPLRIESVAYGSCVRNADANLVVTKHGVHTTFTYSEAYSENGKPRIEWIRCSAAFAAASPEQGLHVRREVVPASAADD